MEHVALIAGRWAGSVSIGLDDSWVGYLGDFKKLSGSMITIGTVVDVIVLVACVVGAVWAKVARVELRDKSWFSGVVLALVVSVILGSLCGLAGWGMNLLGPITA
jgi:hypothetical protein